ncbi:MULTISPECIES: hypothetical protein [Streptomyces]|uniref:Transposase n=1 Tax=Streptomyces ramulosus TaxID=47762 RepID=A0ABW1FN38_9ACTN
MTGAGTVPVTVRLAYGTRARLRELLCGQRQWRRELAAGERWSTKGLGRREASAVRAAWRQELAGLRERGQLLDSLDALATLGVRREVAHRGWDRPWPACPPQARDLGRWPGSADGGFPEQLSLRLPASLENQVRAACWYASYEAIEALEEWRLRYPQVMPRRRWAPTGLESALAAYDRLAARVITTGEIWRAGIRHGMATAAGHRAVGAGGHPP